MDGLFYTLRKAGPRDEPLYELAKWQDDEEAPLDIYVMRLPSDLRGSFQFRGCNCPSRSNPCKHYQMALDLLTKAEESDFLPYYYWQDGQVYPAFDIISTEQLKDLLANQKGTTHE